MADFRFLSLLGSILLVLVLDFIAEFLLFSPSAISILEQSDTVRPIVIAAGLVFLLFFIPGYLIAILWEEVELFAGFTLAAASLPVIVMLNHIPPEAGLEFYSVSHSYYYGAVMLATNIGAWVRSEVSN